MKNFINHIIRTVLRDESPAANGWNIPSDEVWENIERELKTERNNQFSYLWFSLGFIGLVLFSFLLIRQCSLMDRPSNRQLNSISFLDQEKNNVKSEEASQQNQKNVVPITQNGKTQIDNLSGSVSSTAAIDLSAATHQADVIKAKTPPTHNQDLFLDPIDLVQETTANFAKRNELNPGEWAPNTKAAGVLTEKLSLLPIQPIRAADLFAELAGSSPSERSGHILFPVKNRKSWILTADFSPGMSFVQTTLFHSQDQGVFANHSDFSYQLGLRSEYYFSKHWGIGTGLWYQRVQLQSEYGMRLAYTSHNEHQNPDGHFDNTYQAEMPSLLGEMSAELALLRLNNSTLDEGTPFGVSLTMEHRLELLNLPLYLSWKSSGWPVHFYLRAGGVINYLVKQPASFVSRLESHHEAIHHRHSDLSGLQQEEHLRKWQFSLLVGAGIAYPIRSHWDIALEPHYVKGLTPFYEDERVRSRINSWGASFSIRYHLR